MGKIWLQTANGHLIHAPIVGDDFNSPDDAIKIPASILANKNRCFSGLIAQLKRRTPIVLLM